MYLLLRNTFVPLRVGPETLEGARAIAQERLAPRGHVRLGGEIWQAESLRPQANITPGTPVIVRGTRGLTLLVEPE